MTRKRNVLVFPAGTEIGNEVLAALRYCKEVRLFGAGQDVLNHAQFSYPEYHPLPNVHEDGWLTGLNELCRGLEIDYVIPAHDDAVVALSREQSTIPAVVLSSPAETCEVTRSKSATYRRLASVVRVPRIFESPADVEDFPVFVKPDRGQGSAGVQMVETPKGLENACATISSPIICEYLPGDEYTVDCFSDRERGVLFAGARRRRRTRNGISVNTITADLPEAQAIAEAIGEELGLRGAWFFQVKRASDGELTLLEVAPRIAGSMATHRVMGVNFPLLSIFEAERLPLSILRNVGVIELDRALNSRYRHQVVFESVYLDLDDTLLLNERINPALIRFLYQCFNEGKKLVLITRHAGDLTETLARHRIGSLFDQVIHLTKDEPKSLFITGRLPIFIDDSYAERLEVATAHGIPTFDCSMVELLADQAENLTGIAK